SGRLKMDSRTRSCVPYSVARSGAFHLHLRRRIANKFLAFLARESKSLRQDSDKRVSKLIVMAEDDVALPVGAADMPALAPFPRQTIPRVFLGFSHACLSMFWNASRCQHGTCPGLAPDSRR